MRDVPSSDLVACAYLVACSHRHIPPQPFVQVRQSSSSHAQLLSDPWKSAVCSEKVPLVQPHAAVLCFNACIDFHDVHASKASQRACCSFCLLVLVCKLCLCLFL